MNTAAIKNAAIAKAKGTVSNSVSNGNANGGASKKRRGNNQLKPIITNESGAGDKDRETSAASTNSNMNKYVIPQFQIEGLEREKELVRVIRG